MKKARDDGEESTRPLDEDERAELERLRRTPAMKSTNTARTATFADPWDKPGCGDNAVAESFFATYKKELIHTRPWPTIDQLKTATFSWIETYYNRTRRAFDAQLLDTAGI